MPYVLQFPMVAQVPVPADVRMAHTAKKHGAKYSLRIIIEAKRAGIPVSLGFAIVEQESGGRNVFGHDAGGPYPGESVTKPKVKALLAHVAKGGTSNGVGVTQLTWPPLIREAQRQGGAHVPRAQLRVAFTHVAALIRQYGTHDGLRRYNGSGPRALQYASCVLKRQARWHSILK